ncbi:NADH dehydrogenase [Flavobacterium suaedae]|uniref:NADH:ubiquinone reductase (non-electrogenic) n=1 Tax=Flavobacterium suaedae TaxID=1767027 RepID=A0ABQ1K4S2_9FLAO|nr:NAD(P)/FAD-dependent oxidoreductase [Flavobacterium suaedae]GGB83310.1 NADH dehydrogenase [Flavobacterium suaedae]
MERETQKTIVIAGAGFAGLRLAMELKNTDYKVLIIDQHNYHQFQPLMYQVATARLEPTSISFPLRKIFQEYKNTTVRIAEITQVNPDTKTLSTSIGNFSYDYLVLSFGTRTNYFGNEGLQKYAYPMKSVPEALQLRNHILQTFEDSIKADPKALEAMLNFVVVGGGPTGVELAGALAEMKKNVLPKDYPDMDFSDLKVYLLEGLPNTLNNMSDASKKKSQEYLEDLGVIVETNTMVESYDGETVQLKGGRELKSKNVIWAAGVTGKRLNGIPEEALVRGNRIKVNRLHELINTPDIYAIGDIAYMETGDFPKGHPQLASVAISQAVHLAENFKLKLKGKPLKFYEYKDKGSMATIGKRKAVVDLPQFSFQGRFAWFFWMLVHIMLILNLKNKLVIFINWVMSYFTNDSTLRVILKLPKGEEKVKEV